MVWRGGLRIGSEPVGSSDGPPSRRNCECLRGNCQIIFGRSQWYGVGKTLGKFSNVGARVHLPPVLAVGFRRCLFRVGEPGQSLCNCKGINAANIFTE